MPSPSRADSVRSGNHLLAALTPTEFDRLAPDLEPFPLVAPEVLYGVGDSIEYVYFPDLGVVSVVTLMASGEGVEAATIGSEGMVGLPVFFGETTATVQSIVQISDGSSRMSRESFLRHVEAIPHFRQLLGKYASAFLDQVSQSAACNALHPVIERCARWLLMSHDRMGRRDFHLTHEFLSEMLGVRRPSVTIAAGGLSAAGLIRYRRGSVEVLDREGLEDASCECYAVMRDRFARAL